MRLRGEMTLAVSYAKSVAIKSVKMIVSDSTNSATGPIFVAPVGNQTAAIGREVVFSCSIRNISIRKYKVMMTPEMMNVNTNELCELNSHAFGALMILIS